MSPNENAGLGGGGAGLSFFSAGFTAACAAALSAFVVPGLLEAELRAPKRLDGLGATILALGRGAAALTGFPFRAPGLVNPFAAVEGFPALEPTTILFVAGGGLLSPSRGRLAPASSAEGESAPDPLDEESSLPDCCFRFVEATALS